MGVRWAKFDSQRKLWQKEMKPHFQRLYKGREGDHFGQALTNIYVESRRVQAAYFTGHVAFWMAIANTVLLVVLAVL